MAFHSPALRLTAWLALGCHVLVASGLPLPLGVTPGPTDRATAARIAGKDRSRPFPCMDKPCGCATAEQCFANCCCHTPAERLAWAQAHAVEPAVLAALERRVATQPEPAATCCSTRRAAPTCCASDDESPLALDESDVCRDYQSLAADRPATEAAADDAAPHKPAPRAVILRDMLACGGIVAGWLACGAAVPPPPRVVVTEAADPLPAFLALHDERAASFRADPSAPPPRAA